MPRRNRRFYPAFCEEVWQHHRIRAVGPRGLDRGVSPTKYRINFLAPTAMLENELVGGQPERSCLFNSFQLS